MKMLATILLMSHKNENIMPFQICMIFLCVCVENEWRFKSLLMHYVLIKCSVYIL